MSSHRWERAYPVRVEARLDPDLSRWLWLVKWLLAVPHYLVLALLWIAFAVLTLVALVAIVVTTRYPRALFDFNVGVLRWTWRVHYYAYAALGTDRYPPFTLADVPDYPARLEIAYPARLSRGLALVKWWLLAIPHYIVVAVFTGSGPWWFGGTADTDGADGGGVPWSAGGLIGVLVLIAAVVLLFTGRYPKPVYDLVLGLDRWVVRVAAYATLMTDRYPPFRLDLGGHDPAGPIPGGRVEPTPPAPHGGWTGGRVAATITGSVLALAATGVLSGGGALLWAHTAERDADGYLTVHDTVSTSTSAVTAEHVRLGGQWRDTLGDIRIRARALAGTGPVFLGVAPAADAERYLAGVRRAEIRELGQDGVVVRPGGPLPGPPGERAFWTARESGTAPTVTLPPGGGSWTVVLTEADARAGLDVRVEAGATVPALPWIAAGVLAGGAVLLAGGATLIGVAVHRAARQRE
ncbi:DUF4389 domain-containing protein [Saccharomonospora saliphila]|uniref:DUF4389 domain-containing protein n=1 Tax=Saccharomonospora saliphila TaxID=369829 RepID=UPI00049023F5|nr:DUF4389 domain-containing protein [Saccharomonospora saliphila]